MKRAGKPAILMLMSAGIPVQAEICAPDVVALDRGETRHLVICAAVPVAPSALATPPGVDVSYLQPLRHCTVTDRRPGVQLVLRAGDDALPGTLQLGAAGSGQPACDAIRVEIPERLHLPGARLTRRHADDDTRLLLEIEAPAGVDLSPACAAGPAFPASEGPGLAQDNDQDGKAPAPYCGKKRLRWPVTATDRRQPPAKIFLPGVTGPDGKTVPAVTYATAPPPRWLSAMAPEDARYVEAAGVRTRYFEGGKGEALVLVHGGQPSSMDGTAWDWQQNFQELSRHFHVYALDRIGQGYTDNPANLDEYQDYYPLVVRHVLDFIRGMGLERVHLVGHSQGSWPVTRIALDHPELVSSLTLVDGTMVSPSRDAGSAIRFYMYLAMDLHPASGETLESVRRGMEFFSFTQNNLTDQRVQRLLEMTTQPKYAESQAWFARSGMSPAHPGFRALKQQLLSELEAGGLKVPVLVVWGNNDPEGSLPSGLELFRLASASSPRAQLHVFGRSGHLSFIEYPEAFNRVLVDFVLGGR